MSKRPRPGSEDEVPGRDPEGSGSTEEGAAPAAAKRARVGSLDETEPILAGEAAAANNDDETDSALEHELEKSAGVDGQGLAGDDDEEDEDDDGALMGAIDAADEDEDEEDSDIPEKESVVAEAAAETDVVAEAEDAGVVDSGVDAGTPVAIEAGDARATAAMGTDMEDKDVPDTPQGGTAETKEVAETKDPAAGADDSPPQASEQGEAALEAKPSPEDQPAKTSDTDSKDEAEQKPAEEDTSEQKQVEENPAELTKSATADSAFGSAFGTAFGEGDNATAATFGAFAGSDDHSAFGPTNGNTFGGVSSATFGDPFGSGSPADSSSTGGAAAGGSFGTAFGAAFTGTDGSDAPAFGGGSGGGAFGATETPTSAEPSESGTADNVEEEGEDPGILPGARGAKVSNGEEGEATVYQVRAKLFAFDKSGDAPVWRECGTGPLRVKRVRQAKEGTGAGDASQGPTSRIILRRESTPGGVGTKLLLNVAIFKDMVIDKVHDKAMKLSCVLPSGEVSIFLVKVGRMDESKRLFDVLEQMKAELK